MFNPRDKRASTSNPSKRSRTVGINECQKDALFELQDQGLTYEMLVEYSAEGHAFYKEHFFALVNLVKERDYSVVDALSEVAGLTKKQAKGIENGLTRQDVLPLTNVWHITALEDLKKDGLTADILLTFDESIYKFGPDHYSALVFLIRNCQYRAKKALAAIDGISGEEALEVSEKGWSNHRIGSIFQPRFNSIRPSFTPCDNVGDSEDTKLLARSL
ncbi:hypothetical protein [Legionella sp. PC997]|uniref:hypothetical protein n=1 Tax=Legionella sp. PC997 TaxID=2755562 RepID=UPI0015F99F3F|nr:hypothetical protein [Legionella sp. PC997]QMT59182.1 hypothetical protein HBNCFIEN_00543 [Legionella sp. PC997]